MTHASSTPASAASTSLKPASRAGDIALIAVFAALIAAFAMLPPIPVGPLGVPITLQTFAIALTGLVLGLIGLPIFSGMRGGIAVLAGPSAGYILAFTLYALAAGFAARWALRRFSGGRLWAAMFAGALAASLLIVHPLGILGMSINGDLPLGVAAAADLIYWPGDIIKTVLSVSVALLIHRAFPDILRRRGARPQAPDAQ